MTEQRMHEIRKTVLNFKRIGNIAIQKVIQENRKLGIPNVFSRNGRVYYEMPDGTVTTELNGNK